WFSPACLPAEAYRKSGGGEWFAHCAEWLAADGKRFAVNFYYGALMEVDAEAIDDYVLKMARTDHYGAMSMSAFFAELYARYLDPPEHRERIMEPPVLKWLETNVGPRRRNHPARRAGGGVRTRDGRGRRPRR